MRIFKKAPPTRTLETLASHPTISVVIPAYNSGTQIADALSSIWNQTLLPDEIIVVDDCSTDGTPERVEALAARSPVPLKVIRRETNSGFPARPMNDGVAAASGELIAVLDHDDVWLPTKLQRESQALRSQPEAAFAFSLHGTLGEPRASRRYQARKSAWLKRSMSPAGEYYSYPGQLAFELFVRRENFVIGFPGFTFRRRLWQEKEGFDESVKIATDYEFLCWLCQHGDVMFVPRVHFQRREHDNNLTARDLLRLLDVVRVLLRYIPVGEMATRPDYQGALAGKLFALARHFTRAGRWLQALELLRLVDALDFPSPTVAFRRRALPVKLLTLRALRAAGRGRPVRDVTTAEADQGVATLRQWFTDYGLLPALGNSEPRIDD